MLRDDEIALVKSSVSMRDLARTMGFKVTPAGFMKCPFHSGDDTASLKVYDGHRGFYCYGCNKGGDIFRFVQDYMGMNFEASVRYVAGVFNIPLSDPNEKPDKASVKASMEEVRRRRLEREKAEDEANRKKDRLNELSKQMQSYEDLAATFAPDRVTGYSDIWCRLKTKVQDLENEWYGLFEDLYGNKAIHQRGALRT